MLYIVGHTKGDRQDIVVNVEPIIKRKKRADESSAQHQILSLISGRNVQRLFLIQEMNKVPIKTICVNINLFLENVSHGELL